MIETDLLFELLVIAFDSPAQLRESDERLKRRSGREI
jgi:hypothetical protein